MARLIRDERASEPVTARAGTVVEFRRAGQLLCGYLECPPAGWYRVVGIDGHPHKLRRDKIVDVSRDLVPASPVDEGLRNLHAIDDRREMARHAVDLDTLWRVVVDAGPRRLWSLDELLDLHDSVPVDATRRTGMLRALWQGDRFDREGKDWQPRTTESVAQQLQAAEREAQQQENLQELAAWLRRVADGDAPDPRPPEAEEVVALLEAAAVGHDTAASVALMQAAHMHGARSAFHVLVRLGHWTADESLELHRLGVPDEFPQSVLDTAQQAASQTTMPAWPGRRRWGANTYVSSSGARAYRFRRSLRGRGVLEVHLAVPALWVDGVVQAEAAERGRTVGIVEREIPLLPAAILEASRLTAAAARPALTLRMRLDDELNPCAVELKLSRVRPRARLSATEVEAGPAWRRLQDLAQALRGRRRSAGAWQVQPSPWIELLHGLPLPATESPAAQIDTELYLLATEALGCWCQQQGVPALYATQEVIALEDSLPRNGVAAAGVRAFLLENHATAENLGTAPGSHAGLGLGHCAAGVAPMRGYVDLIMQRQLLAWLGVVGAPLPLEALERALLETAAARDAARRVEADSLRYWTLKWLEGLNPDAGVSCVVVEPRGPGYLVLLEGGPMGAFAPAGHGERIEAVPGQRLRLRIDQVSARQNILRLADPRPE